MEKKETMLNALKRIALFSKEKMIIEEIEKNGFIDINMDNIDEDTKFYVNNVHQWICALVNIGLHGDIFSSLVIANIDFTDDMEWHLIFKIKEL